MFAPVHDLTSLSRSGSLERATVRGHKNDVQLTGGEILGDEYSDHIVKVCFKRQLVEITLILNVVDARRRRSW